MKGLAKGLSLTVIPESEVINWKQSLAAKDEEIHKLNLEKEEQVKKVALLENEESNTAETPECTDAVKKIFLQTRMSLLMRQRNWHYYQFLNHNMWVQRPIHVLM